MTHFCRALVSLTALSCVGLAACSSSSTNAVAPITPSASLSPSAPAAVCPGDPHVHVYHPDRLRLLAACVRVTGAIDLVQPQPDGDDHVLLHLDAGQTCASQPCLDQDNLSQQAGDLLLEPVCEHEVTQADAIAACQGYQNDLVVPPVGTRVAATGPFVLDVDHGWDEIHPLEAITVLPGASPAESPNSSPMATGGPVALAVMITASSYGHVAATTSPGRPARRRRGWHPAGSAPLGLQVTVTAGPDGTAAWTYRTSANTTPGTGTHTVTCTLNGATASSSAPFTVP